MMNLASGRMIDPRTGEDIIPPVPPPPPPPRPALRSTNGLVKSGKRIMVENVTTQLKYVFGATDRGEVSLLPLVDEACDLMMARQVSKTGRQGYVNDTYHIRVLRNGWQYPDYISVWRHDTNPGAPWYVMFGDVKNSSWTKAFHTSEYQYKLITGNYELTTLEHLANVTRDTALKSMIELILNAHPLQIRKLKGLYLNTDSSRGLRFFRAFIPGEYSPSRR